MYSTLQIPTDNRCMRGNAGEKEKDEEDRGECGSDKWSNVCVWSVAFANPPIDDHERECGEYKIDERCSKNKRRVWMDDVFNTLGERECSKPSTKQKKSIVDEYFCGVCGDADVMNMYRVRDKPCDHRTDDHREDKMDEERIEINEIHTRDAENL